MGYEPLNLFIDGEWRSGGGAGEQVINPATELSIADLPHANEADLDEAVGAAVDGFKTWSAMSPFERCAIMRKGMEIVRARADAIAETLTLEEGKAFGEAKGEVLVSADIIDWYADEGCRTYGRVIPSRQAGVSQFVKREPVGVCAAFTPWNFPALTPARKIGGALGSGCSLILKPSEETPGTVIAFARALDEAGLPRGVLNIVFGAPADVSGYLIPREEVRKVSFTGSTAVGKHLAQMAAAGMKPVTMELGGHAPVIVCDDVDVAKAAKMSVASKYRNAGQVCISPTRFFVHDKVYGAFVDAFTELAAATTVGYGMEKGVRMGPLANERRVEAIDAFVKDAVEHGADLKTGGERIGNQGYFYAPTVLADVSREARIMNEEPFGPIAPMQRFTDLDEVLAEANRLEYGLAAYAFTADASRAGKIADQLESGMVGVNSFNISLPETPFGGVKGSGYGREGGVEGLESYLTVKFVSQSPA